MYTKASLPHMKEKVLATFRVIGSTLRIVIATTAFSMGIDCPDVHRVFHLVSLASPLPVRYAAKGSGDTAILYQFLPSESGG